MIYLPANIYLFKFNNKNTGKKCEICSKLTLKIPERFFDVSGVFIVNFGLVPHPFTSVSIADLNKLLFAE